jgi:hypothetical protein
MTASSQRPLPTSSSYTDPASPSSSGCSVCNAEPTDLAGCPSTELNSVSSSPIHTRGLFESVWFGNTNSGAGTNVTAIWFGGDGGAGGCAAAGHDE